MARQSHTVQTGSGKYPTTASLTALTWLAANAVDFEQVDFSGREILLARNTSADTAYNVTVTSVASVRTARTGNIVKSLAFGAQLPIGPLGIDGWRQSNGKLYFAGANAAIEFAVVRL